MHARPLSSSQAHHHISRHPRRRNLSSASGPKAEDDSHEDLCERALQAGHNDQDPREDYSAVEEIVLAPVLTWWVCHVDHVFFCRFRSHGGEGLLMHSVCPEHFVGLGNLRDRYISLSRERIEVVGLGNLNDRYISLDMERIKGAVGRTHQRRVW